MLAAESNLNESEGTLILGADQSPGRHIAAALMRLERRTMLHQPADQSLDRLKPFNAEVLRSTAEIPTLAEIFAAKRDFMSLIVCPSLSLSTGQQLAPAQLAELLPFLETLESRMPQVRKIGLLTEFENPHAYQSLQKSAPSVTWLVCPLVVGFRDESIMDELFSPLRRQKALKFEWKPAHSNARFVFANDVASAVVSLILKNQSPGATIRLESNSGDLSVLVDAFVRSMPEVRRGKLRRYFAETNLVGEKIRVPSSETLFQHPEFQHFLRASEIFPNPTTPTHRFFAHAKDLWQREPDLDLHFPPSRAL